MKFSLDLIRVILLQIEAQPRGFIEEQIFLDDYSNDEVVYHLVLMMDKGLIEGFIHPSFGQYTPVVLVKRMTWAGHDFLDACRNEERWTKAKEIFRKLDGVTFDVIKQVLVELTVAEEREIISGGSP
jgi:hypothetical protein